jgi:Acetyltransferase (GNAT) domain
VIATVPSSQRRGLGTALLEQSLQVVDNIGLPAYLDSTNPRNVSLYQRHGFATTGPIELPDGPVLIKMWRGPPERAHTCRGGDCERRLSSAEAMRASFRRIELPDGAENRAACVDRSMPPLPRTPSLGN